MANYTASIEKLLECLIKLPGVGRRSAEKVAQGYSILDVRTQAEFSQGSIPRAINIPIDEIRERTYEIPSGKILVTCQVGQRGHAATRLLIELGYDAANLDGGYLTWSNSPAKK